MSTEPMSNKQKSGQNAEHDFKYSRKKNADYCTLPDKKLPVILQTRTKTVHTSSVQIA